MEWQAARRWLLLSIRTDWNWLKHHGSTFCFLQRKVGDHHSNKKFSQFRGFFLSFSEIVNHTTENVKWLDLKVGHRENITLSRITLSKCCSTRIRRPHSQNKMLLFCKLQLTESRHLEFLQSWPTLENCFQWRRCKRVKAFGNILFAPSNALFSIPTSFNWRDHYMFRSSCPELAEIRASWRSVGLLIKQCSSMALSATAAIVEKVRQTKQQKANKKSYACCTYRIRTACFVSGQPTFYFSFDGTNLRVELKRDGFSCSSGFARPCSHSHGAQDRSSICITSSVSSARNGGWCYRVYLLKHFPPYLRSSPSEGLWSN